jgi:hypothetical protein
MATRRRALATGKQMARISGPFAFISQPSSNQLQRLNIRRLHTFRAFLRFEADFLILLQTFEAFGANLGEMREKVVTATVRSDKPKSLRIVEPLHSTGCHLQIS